MFEVADALAEILRHAKLLPPRTVRLAPVIVGGVLAQDIRAEADSPPFDKSLRDGYAVRAADCAAKNPELRYLQVVDEIAAGAVPTRRIEPGECARIFTGAPIPEGADAVVMQENTTATGETVQILDANVKPGQWVFARGSEMRSGDVVLETGTVLSPASVGVLAGLGITQPLVTAIPSVGVLATGNELVDASETPGPGQIRNSNGPMLAAQAARTGAIVHDLGIAADTADELTRRISEELSKHQVLILAGGVSVGKFDLVPAALEQLGVAIHFRQVRLKPGKPLLFGTFGDTLVFGLPGNPVSAFVCFELFVRPALRALAGHIDPGPFLTSLPLADAIAATHDRPTYHPAKLERGETGWAVRPLPWLGAADLRGLQPADAFVVLPAGETRLDRGSLVRVVLMD